MNEYYGEDYFPYISLGLGVQDILSKEEGLNEFIISMLINIPEFFAKYSTDLPIYLKHSIIDIYADIYPKYEYVSIKNDVYKELINYLIEKKVSYDDFISYTLLFDEDYSNKQEFITYLDLFTTRYVKNEIEKICKKIKFKKRKKIRKKYYFYLFFFSLNLTYNYFNFSLNFFP